MSRVSLRARRQRPRCTPCTQRGIALLVAILLVALGTIIAAAVAYENATTARRGTATYAFDQALLIAEGAEALAAYGLRQIRQNDQSHTTYAAQGWAKGIGPIEVVPGVMLEASLEDLQGRFNLNNLVKNDTTPDPVQLQAFMQLLALAGVETKWAGYIVDWIDGNITPSSPDGAEDSVYMGQTPPYRTANRYITSASELLALPGFGRDRYLKLAPYVTALPYNTPVNLCTAPGLVLDAYLGQRDFSSEADSLAKNRATAPGCFPTQRDYEAAFADPKLLGQVRPKIAQISSYFRLTSFITIGSTEFNLYSLLYQDQNSVRPILRSFTPD
ncbi:MAG TPA: type II secretion system minor pseudopilin GspK [Steroidobacteraceae bacterium]|nr:type II secretion system minor pseudopilin GspK [Steroidobacteraceae bacterium]